MGLCGTACNCWIFGCHAPYRGGDLRIFLQKSADLSPAALSRLRTEPPFNQKDWLGSRAFPVCSSGEQHAVERCPPAAGGGAPLLKQKPRTDFTTVNAVPPSPAL